MAWLNRVRWLLGNKDTSVTIVMVGLPHSGKSTLMLQLKPPEVAMVSIQPTLPIDYKAVRFRSKALTFVAFDLEELDGFGCPWEEFYRECQGVMFVVDSSQRLSLPRVALELEKLLANPILVSKKIPLIVLANKMDHCNALPCYQLSKVLRLEELCAGERPWYVAATDGLTGEGIHEALDWFVSQIKRHVSTTESK